MAISLRTSGTWADSNATTQTVTLPTHATGDMLIVRTVRKPFTSPDNTVINTSGWTAVATGFANGSTANGAGVGSMGFKAFWKIATSSSETNPVVTWGTTSAPGAAVAMAYQCGNEYWITPTGSGGGNATAATSQSSTIASHISVTTGDMVDFFRGCCDDNTLTVPTITQTGVTYGTVAEEPAAALSSGTSNDISADGGYRLASSGTSSAAAVVTGTSSASDQYGAWMTRLRVAPSVTGSFTANAVIKKTIASSFTADAVIPAPTGYAATVIADSPVSYWRLGETAGTNLNDEVGSNDMTLYGTYTLNQPGAIDDGNPAIFFSNVEGSGGQSASPTGIPLGNSSRSLEWWWKSTSTIDYNAMFSYGEDATNQAFAVWVTAVGADDHIFISTFGGGVGGSDSNFSAGVALLDGAWHHGVVTYNSATGDLTVYIDGALATGTANPQNIGTMATALNTGGMMIAAESMYSSGVGDLNGTPNSTIDEVALYDYVLTPAQVANHYTMSGFYDTDNANRTIASGSGWGSTSGEGQAWNLSTNTLMGADGSGLFFAATSSASRLGYVAVVEQDVDSVFTFEINLLPTASQTYDIWVIGRYIDADNYYRLRVRYAPSTNLFVQTQKYVATTATNIGTNTDTGIAPVVNTKYKVRAQFDGLSPTTLRMKVWAASGVEPSSWLVEDADSEGALQTATPAGYGVRFLPGLTYVVTAKVDAFEWKLPPAAGGTITGTFTANAALKRTQTASFTANAALKRTQTGTFTANATIKRTPTGTFTANAVAKRTQTATFTANAVRKTTATGGFTANTVLRRTMAAAFTADAVIPGGVGVVWTTPANLVSIDALPTLAFLIPSGTGDFHFEMQLDTAATFNTGNLRIHKSNQVQTGWEYFNGSIWVAVPAGGVPDTYVGNEARYTLQTPLANGTWYRRVRAGIV